MYSCHLLATDYKLYYIFLGLLYSTPIFNYCSRLNRHCNNFSCIMLGSGHYHMYLLEHSMNSAEPYYLRLWLGLLLISVDWVILIWLAFRHLILLTPVYEMMLLLLHHYNFGLLYFSINYYVHSDPHYYFGFHSRNFYLFVNLVGSRHILL